jgi:hypothetical protein
MNQWYSQAAQDRFVNEVLIKPERMLEGTYIDIGGCHPIEINNTYALEQRGWRGVSIDIDANAVALHQTMRANVIWCADATRVDWEARLAEVRPRIGPVVDYLSLDVDAATLAALENLLRAELQFRVITAEHDSYRFGPGPRDAMRVLLRHGGYDLLCADVCSADGQPFEDWWVAPDLIPNRDYERFRCSGKKWTEILPP